MTTQTHNTVPQQGAGFYSDLATFLRNEDAQRFADMFQSFVVSGGTHSTGVGLTQTPDALIAYPGGYYATETGAITYPDNATCWVAAHKDTTTAVVGFSRVSGTHYLMNTASATRPATPAGSVWLMQVVTSSGSVTSVTDLRLRSPTGNLINPRNAPYNAAGDGATDDTTSLQLAIADAYPTGAIILDGRFRITDTLLIDGTLGSVRFVGTTGMHNQLAGGALFNSASELLWDGVPGGVMLKVSTSWGVDVRHVAFTTASSNDQIIDIDNVIGIQYVNPGGPGTHFSVITHNEFRRVAIPVEFLDDGSSGGNTNMDGHQISENFFITYREGVRINQTNANNVELSHNSFYGGTTYAKHHVHIVKGFSGIHVNGGYMGPLKDAGSVGGKNGIAVYIESGSLNLNNVYAETHNAPFLDWVVADPAGIGSVNLVSCNIASQTATIPTTYNIRNQTGGTLSVIGGTVSAGSGGALNQADVANGGTVIIGVTSATFDPAGALNRMTRYSNYLNTSLYGLIGTSGLGLATIYGTAPRLSFTADPSGEEVLILTGTGDPENAVTARVGSLFLRTDGGVGSSLYVKQSGTGNTGWAAK